MAFLCEPLIDDGKIRSVAPLCPASVARRSPLAIMGYAYVSGTNLSGVLKAQGC
jgi:hypothetical protein